MLIRKKKYGLAVLVLLVGWAISPSIFAQTTWNSVLQKATKEGRVTLYASLQPPVIRRLVADFQKAYPGIQVEASRASGGPLLAKLDMERQTQTDGGDVLISSELGWFEARAEEKALFQPTGPAAAAWPAKYLVAGTIVIGSLEPFVIAYNSNVVKTEVKSYTDLLNPQFGGAKMGITDINSSTTQVAFYDWLEKTSGSEFMQKLSAQRPQVYPGTVAPTQAVASGEIIASVASNPSAILGLVEQGAPIKYAVPKPARGISYEVAALRWSKRPNASQVFVDYLMSKRGQQQWNGKGESASPLSGIEGSLDASSISSAYDPKDYPPQVVKTLTEKWNKQFKN
jgi:iron(III) transport system substrate-binding protein